MSTFLLDVKLILCEMHPTLATKSIRVSESVLSTPETADSQRWMGFLRFSSCVTSLSLKFLHENSFLYQFDPVHLVLLQ